MDCAWLWCFSVGSSALTTIPFYWGDVENGEGCACMRSRDIKEISVPSSKFCYEHKTALKKMKHLNKQNPQKLGEKIKYLLSSTVANNHTWFVVVLLLSWVRFIMTPWTAACQASLSFTISQILLKYMSIELVILYNHLIRCHPLPLLPSIFPSIQVFPNESGLCIRWPKF